MTFNHMQQNNKSIILELLPDLYILEIYWYDYIWTSIKKRSRAPYCIPLNFISSLLNQMKLALISTALLVLVLPMVLLLADFAIL